MNELAERIGRHISANGSYTEGLRLLAEINTPAVLFRICSVSENSYTRNKTMQLLQAYIDGQAAIIQPRAEKIREIKLGLLPSESDAAPAEIKAALKKRNQLYGYCRELHGQMKLMVYERHKFSDDDRRKSRQFAERAWREIDEFWKYTRYFDENKNLMPDIATVPKVAIVGDNKLKHRLNTLRTYTTPSYISRLNNPEKTEAHRAERNATEQRLLELETEE